MRQTNSTQSRKNSSESVESLLQEAGFKDPEGNTRLTQGEISLSEATQIIENQLSAQGHFQTKLRELVAKEGVKQVIEALNGQRSALSFLEASSQFIGQDKIIEVYKNSALESLQRICQSTSHADSYQPFEVLFLTTKEKEAFRTASDDEKHTKIIAQLALKVWDQLQSEFTSKDISSNQDQLLVSMILVQNFLSENQNKKPSEPLSTFESQSTQRIKGLNNILTAKDLPEDEAIKQTKRIETNSLKQIIASSKQNLSQSFDYQNLFEERDQQAPQDQVSITSASFRDQLKAAIAGQTGYLAGDQTYSAEQVSSLENQTLTKQLSDEYALAAASKIVDLTNSQTAINLTDEALKQNFERYHGVGNEGNQCLADEIAINQKLSESLKNGSTKALPTLTDALQTLAKNNKFLITDKGSNLDDYTVREKLVAARFLSSVLAQRNVEKTLFESEAGIVPNHIFDSITNQEIQAFGDGAQHEMAVALRVQKIEARVLEANKTTFERATEAANSFVSMASQFLNNTLQNLSKTSSSTSLALAAATVAAYFTPVATALNSSKDPLITESADPGALLNNSGNSSTSSSTAFTTSHEQLGLADLCIELEKKITNKEVNISKIKEDFKKVLVSADAKEINKRLDEIQRNPSLANFTKLLLNDTSCNIEFGDTGYRPFHVLTLKQRQVLWNLCPDLALAAVLYSVYNYRNRSRDLRTETAKISKSHEILSQSTSKRTKSLLVRLGKMLEEDQSLENRPISPEPESAARADSADSQSDEACIQRALGFLNDINEKKTDVRDSYIHYMAKQLCCRIVFNGFSQKFHDETFANSKALAEILIGLNDEIRRQSEATLRTGREVLPRAAEIDNSLAMNTAPEVDETNLSARLGIENQQTSQKFVDEVKKLHENSLTLSGEAFSKLKTNLQTLLQFSDVSGLRASLDGFNEDYLQDFKTAATSFLDMLAPSNASDAEGIKQTFQSALQKVIDSREPIGIEERQKLREDIAASQQPSSTTGLAAAFNFAQTTQVSEQMV